MREVRTLRVLRVFVVNSNRSRTTTAMIRGILRALTANPVLATVRRFEGCVDDTKPA